MQRAISEPYAAEYAKLLGDYRDLAEGIRMIRRAADRAHRSGVLPAVDETGKTPLEECEAIARAIYRAVRTAEPRHVPKDLSGIAEEER